MLDSNFLYASTTDSAYWLNDISQEQGFNVREFRNENNLRVDNIIAPSGKNSNNYTFLGNSISLGSNGLRSNEVLSSFDVPTGTYMWSLDATGQVEMYDYTTNISGILYDGLTIWNNPMCITDKSKGYTSYHLREPYFSPDVSGIVIDIGGVKFVRQVRIGDKIKEGDVLYFGAPYFLIQNWNLGFRVGKDGYLNIFFKAKGDGTVISRSKSNNTSHMTGVFTGSEKIDHVDGSSVDADKYAVRPVFDFTRSDVAFVRERTSGGTLTTSSSFGDVPSADARNGEDKKVVVKSNSTTISNAINDTKISTDNSANGHANVTFSDGVIKVPFGAKTLTMNSSAFTTANANYISALADAYSTQKYAVLGKTGQNWTIDLGSIVNTSQIGSTANVSFYAEATNEAGNSDVISATPVTLQIDVVEGPEQTIKYDNGGGTGTLPSNAKVRAGKSYALADGSGLSKDGNLFSCWQLTYTPYGETDEVTRLIKSNEAIVVPDAQGGTITATAKYSGVSATKTTETPSSVVTVTWDSNAPSGFTATFTDASGSGVSFNDDKSIRYDKIKIANSSITVPGAPTLNTNTWIFDGWYTQASGGVKVTGSVGPSTNTTYYAHWLNGYTVTYDATGGTGATLSGKFSDGTTTDSELVMPGGTTVGPSKGKPVANDSSNYKFYGWYNKPNGQGGPFNEEGTSFEELGGSKTVYAYYDLANTFLAPATSSVTANPRNISGTKYSIAQVKEAAADINTNGTSSSYYSQYTSWMNGDSYHLYTLLDGKNASSADSWVEFRIVHVGTKDSADKADGVGLTFQAVHMLPTAYQMNGYSTNRGGWASSVLRKNMNSGAIYNMFDIQLTSRTVDVSTGSKGKLWLVSYSELTGTSQSDIAKDGEQFAYWSGKVTNPTTGGNSCLIIAGTRSGGEVASIYYSGNWWLRSPYTEDTTYFYRVYSDGTPSFNSSDSRSLGVVPCFSL